MKAASREDRGERRAAAGQRRPEQRAGDGAALPVDLDRHLPVEHLRPHGLVARPAAASALAHPVEAVVVPLEPAGPADLLPLRLALAVDAGGYVDVGEAVLVEVVGLGVGVDLDGAVGESRA